MRSLLCALALTLIPSALMTTPALARPCCRVDEPTFPASPAGQCAKAFFTTLANPTPDAVRSFESTWASKARLDKTPIDQRITDLPKVRDEFGTLTITSIDAAKSPLTVLLSSSRGESLAFQFIMSATEPGKLDSIQISPASEVLDPPITAELRVKTVEGVAKALRDGYVFPDIGNKIADSILAKLKSGEYDTITTEKALAARLTDDCRAISSDKHLGIRPNPKETAAASSPDDPRRENFGFKRVELFPGNIGYLRFDAFFESKEAYEVASSAMNFLAGAEAIIFDLRHNGGGSPGMIRHITSYLFEESTHLNDMVDREGKTVSEYWTLTNVPGRRPRAGIPVFILTSNRTFSGAEEFSYNLQNLERATIIGETTGGGAHPVRGSRLNDRFMIRVPYMRARNPITHTNWEGKGVEPDIKAPAESALDKALQLAREAINTSQAKKP